ncbi:hypothetical protein NSZ01_24650 [Nocardioides szechwanensis]|uniref:Uncharacterized protein n=1 Tax=Nocardioides szechwanensis TaxID=1005944 RepID=A0A1H0EEA4_9ACTN|nr:hypothetical protein [Nocardioides szechwanensis]GEP34697.1 hypothetical protein NSZ01_24650 [Nocardioides szechwanensis]SDN80817.1 hypothetical protein SAMN05192576_2836 [Nocardioides szechwanensis]
MGLFKISRSPQAQAERDLKIGGRTSHRSLRELQDQLHAVGDLGLDLDETVRSPSQRQKVDIATLLKALTIATETAEQALAEVIALRQALEGP